MKGSPQGQLWFQKQPNRFSRHVHRIIFASKHHTKGKHYRQWRREGRGPIQDYRFKSQSSKTMINRWGNGYRTGQSRQHYRCVCPQRVKITNSGVNMKVIFVAMNTMSSSGNRAWTFLLLLWLLLLLWCFLGLIFTTAKVVFITVKIAFIFTSLSVVHIFTVITN